MSTFHVSCCPCIFSLNLSHSNKMHLFDHLVDVNMLFEKRKIVICDNTVLFHITEATDSNKNVLL